MFEVYKDKSVDSDENWRWRLKSKNGEIVAQSEPYESRGNATRGVEDTVNAVLNSVSEVSIHFDPEDTKVDPVDSQR